MTPDAILNAAQAAGIGLGVLSNYASNKAADYGLQLAQGQNNLRAQQEQLQTTQQATIATQKLRENLATQAVLAATRGVRTGVGNALASQNTSVGNYNRDVSALKFNNSMKQYELGFNNRMMGIAAKGQQAAKAFSLAGDILDTVSVNEWIQQNKNKSPLGKSEQVNVYG